MTPEILIDVFLIPIIILIMPFAVGIALLICSTLLDKSNNFGDNAGEFDEFGNNDFRFK